MLCSRASLLKTHLDSNSRRRIALWEREGNCKDPYAVAIMQGTTIIGHVLRKISAACSLFLQQNGTIQCSITGARIYSADLPQGGLEVPCVLKFNNKPKYVAKVKKLLTPNNDDDDIQQANKKRTWYNHCWRNGTEELWLCKSQAFAKPSGFDWSRQRHYYLRIKTEWQAHQFCSRNSQESV